MGGCCGALTGEGKRGALWKAGAGGPLLIKPPNELEGGILKGEEDGAAGLGREPNGGTSEPWGGAPETGPIARPLLAEDGNDPGGGLDPKGCVWLKGCGWLKGGPVGLPGVTFGGKVDGGNPEGGTEGLGTTPGGGAPGRENCGEGAEEGNGGGWPNGEGLGAEFGMEEGRLRFKFWKLSDKIFGFCW